MGIGQSDLGAVGYIDRESAPEGVSNKVLSYSIKRTLQLLLRILIYNHKLIGIYCYALLCAVMNCHVYIMF